MYLKHKAIFIGIMTIFLLSSAEAALHGGMLRPPVGLYEAYCGCGLSDSWLQKRAIKSWLDEAITRLKKNSEDWTMFDRLKPTEELLAAAKIRAEGTDLASVECSILEKLEFLWVLQAETVAPKRAYYDVRPEEIYEIQAWLDEAITRLKKNSEDWTMFDRLQPTEELLAAAKVRAEGTDLSSVECQIRDELERLWGLQAEKVARQTAAILSGRCSMSGRVEWKAEQIKAMQQLLAVLTAA